MKTVNTHGSFDDCVSDSSDHVKEIAKRLRNLIIDVYPDVVEVPWPKQRIIGYGIGPKKMSEHFCYVGAYSEYVNLGFYYGAELSDPEGLLEGTGKKFRHIKVYETEAVDRWAIRDIVQRAFEERKKALGMAI